MGVNKKIYYLCKFNVGDEMWEEITRKFMASNWFLIWWQEICGMRRNIDEFNLVGSWEAHLLELNVSLFVCATLVLLGMKFDNILLLLINFNLSNVFGVLFAEVSVVNLWI